ncbi:hypothetical protein [Streptomyces flaveolus]|uniref:hypothetical protein n=1 Tax=Streptomyces flaveolus TaxID=67297 RepID=UPI0033BFEB8A
MRFKVTAVTADNEAGVLVHDAHAPSPATAFALSRLAGHPASSTGVASPPLDVTNRLIAVLSWPVSGVYFCPS